MGVTSSAISSLRKLCSVHPEPVEGPQMARRPEKPTHQFPYLYKYKKGNRKMALKAPLKHQPQIQNGAKWTQMVQK